MSLSKVKFTKAQGGLGAPLPGEDHISGLVHYQNPLTTKKLLFTAALVASNSVHLVLTLPGGSTVTTDIVFATDSDTTMAAIVTWITAQLTTAGILYAVTIDPAGASLKRFILITPKIGQPISITAVVTLGASQATASTSVVASPAYSNTFRFLQIQDAQAVGFAQGDAKTGYAWYHINRFFIKNPQGIFYLWIGDDPAAGAGTNTFTEAITLQLFANGKCRQIGFFLPVTFTTAMVTALQAVYNTLFGTNYAPAILILTADTSAIVDKTTFVDLTTLACDDVFVDIGQDGDNEGAALAVALGKSIGSIGAILGSFSFRKVNENIGWRSYDISDSDGEYANPALGDGSLIYDPAHPISINTLGDIQNKGYIFMLKEIGLTGVFWNDAPACTSPTSDYAHAERTRTMDKCIRGVRAAILPQLNGVVPVDAVSGQLDPAYISELIAIGNQPLQQMVRDGELSGFELLIDPTQDVNANSKITFAVKDVPTGIVREFDVTTGFVTKL